MNCDFTYCKANICNECINKLMREKCKYRKLDKNNKKEKVIKQEKNK